MRFYIVLIILISISCSNKKNEYKKSFSKFPKLNNCRTQKFWDGQNLSKYYNKKAKSYYSKNGMATWKPKLFCGNIKNRFIRFNKKENFIYDEMLKSFWSSSSFEQYSWNDAQSYCEGLGPDWSLPDIYELMSLIHSNKDDTHGFIEPLFNDNEGKFYWTGTQTGKNNNYGMFVHFNLEQTGFFFKKKKGKVRCIKSIKDGSNLALK